MIVHYSNVAFLYIFLFPSLFWAMGLTYLSQHWKVPLFASASPDVEPLGKSKKTLLYVEWILFCYPDNGAHLGLSNQNLEVHFLDQWPVENILSDIQVGQSRLPMKGFWHYSYLPGLVHPLESESANNFVYRC